MNTKNILTSMVILVMLCGCDGEKLSDGQQVRPITSFNVAFETSSTKVFCEKNMLFWNEADSVSVFNAFGNIKYEFSGHTGDNIGELRIASGYKPSTPIFSRYYAIYPYSNLNNCFGDGEFSVLLPDIQNYQGNTFDPKAAIMYAATDAAENNFFYFNTICGFLKLKLYSDDATSIKSIAINGNNGELIAGRINIQIEDSGEANTSLIDGSQKITINCSGKHLSESVSKPTIILIALFPVDFSNGFTITITTMKGREQVICTNKDISIYENTIQPMSPVNILADRPVIGITSGKDDEQSRNAANAYMKSILLAGGMPKLLLDATTSEEALDLLDGVDGLLFPGGGVNATSSRSKTERLLIPLAKDLHIPIMGICRGHQSLNAGLGGKTAMIDDTWPEAMEHHGTTHMMTVDENSNLAKLLKGATRLQVNSIHNGAVYNVSEELKVVARADDEIIEALEGDGLMGFQFHPEKLVCAGDTTFLCVFRELIRLAKTK